MGALAPVGGVERLLRQRTEAAQQREHGDNAEDSQAGPEQPAEQFATLDNVAATLNNCRREGVAVVPRISEIVTFFNEGAPGHQVLAPGHEPNAQEAEPGTQGGADFPRLGVDPEARAERGHKNYAQHKTDRNDTLGLLRILRRRL